MLPRTRRPSQLPRIDRAIAIGFGLLIFGLMGAELLRSFRPANLSAVFILLAYAPLVVLHEAGHAVMAAALGWRVARVVIGFGRTVLRVRVSGVPVELRMFPVSGYVVPVPKSLDGARWRSSLIYLAGPAVEASLLLLLVATVGYDALTTPSESVAMIALQSAAVAILIGLFFNLIPRPAENGAQTDGLGVLSSLVATDLDLQARLTGSYATDAERCLDRGDLKRALAIIQAGVSEHPDNLPMKLVCCELLVEHGEPQRAGQLLEPELEREDLPDRWRAALHHAVAVAARELDDPDALDAADEHAKAAVDLHRNVVRYDVTRASILVERRRFYPALKQLSEARGRLLSEDPVADECDSFMALAELRRGHRDEAQALLDALDQRGARGILVDRVRRELGQRPST